MAIRSTTQIAQPVGPAPELPSAYPTPPKKLVGIDPELEKYHAEQERLYRRIREALSQQGVQVAKSAAEVVKTTTNLSTQLVNLGTVISTTEAELLAAINAEAGIRQTNDGVIATSVTNLTTSVNNQFSAVNQTLATQAQINGQLNASYTLTTTAGNVVTGMRLLSSSGGSGTDVSQVLFQADRFTIYNGTLGVPVFDLNGANIRIGGVTIDSGTGDKLYIGAGNYANSDTSFYVDSTGQMSLKDKLSWDGSNLSITGSITLTNTLPAGSVAGVPVGTYINGSGIYTGSIQANQISATSLSAISADLGTVTISSTGSLKGGQTAYDTGTGFFLGYSGSAYKFSIGNAAGNKLTWDGSQLNIVGEKFSVTGSGGSIEMQAPVSATPGIIRFKDSSGNTRGSLNSDGTFTLNNTSGTPVFSANASSGLANNMVSTPAIVANAVTIPVHAFAFNPVTTSQSWSSATVVTATLDSLSYASELTLVFSASLGVFTAYPNRAFSFNIFKNGIYETGGVFTRPAVGANSVGALNHYPTSLVYKSVRAANSTDTFTAVVYATGSTTDVTGVGVYNASLLLLTTLR